MSRHDQLTQALKQARAAHAAAPSRSTFQRVQAASVALTQWGDRHRELKELRRKAALLYRQDEVTRLDALLAQHALPVNPVGEVSLTGTAGTIRLDLNGRRTFMTPEQAMELRDKLTEVLS